MPTHEESSGIPLIVKGPDLQKGSVCKALVSMIDMMPTCMDLAGIKPIKNVDGKSFAPVLKGQSDNSYNCVFVERDTWCMVVKEDRKLVANRITNQLQPTMLIHLAIDPFEMTNLVNNSKTIETQNNLLAELTKWNNEVVNT